MNIPHLIESAVLLVEKEVTNRCAKVAIDIADELPSLRMDSSQMQQAIVHLLLNASKAIPDQGEVTVRAFRRGEQLCIEVDDSGEGVPEEHRHRIFDPFFTTRESSGDSTPGTGLGLAFTQNISQRHRGVLKLVPSRLGGACFQIALPLKTAERDEEKRTPSQIQHTATPAPAASSQSPLPPTAEIPLTPTMTRNDTRSVMVLEDDEALQEILGDFLEDYDLSMFADGPSAWASCVEKLPDVIVLDQNLDGDWDGARFMEQLATLEFPPPVILCSGSIEPTSSSQLPLTPVAALPKPYQLAELEEALEQALLGIAQ